MHKDSEIEQVFELILSFFKSVDNITLLSVILTKMMEITHSDAGTLYTLKDGKLHFSIMRNVSLGVFRQGDIDLPPIEIDENNIKNISAYVAIKNEIVVIDDVYEDKRFNFDGPKQYDKMTGYRTRSMAALPLVTEWSKPPDIVGVIQLINATDPKTNKIISYGDIFKPPIIPSVSKIAANVLANQVYFDEIMELFKSIVAVVVEAIDERSSYNNIHTQNVARYVENFAQFLTKRFPHGHILSFAESHRMEAITMASLLHDIGKIITPLDIMDKSSRLGDSLTDILYKFDIKFLQLEKEYMKGEIDKKEYDVQVSKHQQAVDTILTLNKASSLDDSHDIQAEALRSLEFVNREGKIEPILTDYDIEALKVHYGTLTPSERAIMEDHVVHTAHLLEKITVWKYFSNVPKWARDHHEFLDGTGYPNKLTAKDITPETRMITIADIFDALIASDRPYKKPVSTQEAFSILKGMAENGKLDRELVELFIESRVWED